jgi:sugar lactone lactonase YvrE
LDLDCTISNFWKMRPVIKLSGKTLARFAHVTLVLLCAITLPAAEAPPAVWAKFLTGTSLGVLVPKIVPNAEGGFYVYSAGDRPLIKLTSDGAIVWEIRFQADINDIREVTDFDILANGDLLAVATAPSNSRLFGQLFTEGGSFLIQLHSADASLVSIKPTHGCALTAIKARPGGGFFVAGQTSADAPTIGIDSLPVTAKAIFLAQFSTGLDWTVSGNLNVDPINYRIQSIRTTGAGSSLRVFAGGNANGAWTFGGKSIAESGAYLLSADGSGQMLGAQTVVTNATFVAIEPTSSGALNLGANAGGQNLIRRIQADGSITWTTSISNVGEISAITGSDEPFVIGGPEAAFVASLDSAGVVKWQRVEANRSRNSGIGIGLLSDGRLAISAAGPPSGIFIDDFLLSDFTQVDATWSGAFVATLETRANAAPVFRVQPRDQKFALRGETLTLHTEVYSPSGATYAWYKDGNLLAGKTSADLVLSNLQAADSGVYFLEARNATSVARSQSVEVVVNTVTMSTIPGTDTAGTFESPRSPTVMLDGSILVADSAQNVIKRVTTAGVTTFAGTGATGLVNGLPLEAQFSAPSGLALEWRYFGPIVYVADRGNNRVRRIHVSAQTGEATLVDQSNAAYPSVSAVGTLDGFAYFIAGGAESETLWKTDADTPVELIGTEMSGGIAGLALDARGNVYVTDPLLNAVHRRNFSGPIEHIATLSEPCGIAIDESDNLYVAERAKHRIVKISPIGAQTIVAGLGSSGLQNGSIAEAMFNAPEGICIRSNALVVADTGNHCLREIKFEPATTVSSSSARIAATVGSFLQLNVSGNVGEQYAIESSGQIGPNAAWQSEGTVSIDQVTSDLLLPKPASTRFYRARKIQ